MKNRSPEAELIRVVKHMQAEGFNVNVLSSVYEDNHSRQEKDTWLKKQGLFLNVIFVPYGKDKKDYINKNVKYQFLIDDFGKNLKNWSEEGDEFISIKFMNEVNSRPKIEISDNGAMQLVPDSWTGYRIDHRMSEKQMYNTLVGLTKML